MGLSVYGIGVAQCPDNVGETILLDGLDISKLKAITDEHGDDSAFRHIGVIKKAKKIYSPEECEDDKQKRCWNSAKVPFLYVEGELADAEDHPNAQSAAALIKFASRPEIDLNIGFSVDGGIAERRDQTGNITEDKEAGKVLAKTVAISMSFTTKPCNPKCFLRMENDLTKSDFRAQPPKRYYEALKKAQRTSSFNEHKAVVLHLRLEKLKKSLSDYTSGITDIKCEKCHNGIRFFKSSKDLPNCCNKCGYHFSAKNIWNALNK